MVELVRSNGHSGKRVHQQVSVFLGTVLMGCVVRMTVAGDAVRVMAAILAMHRVTVTIFRAAKILVTSALRKTPRPVAGLGLVMAVGAASNTPMVLYALTTVVAEALWFRTPIAMRGVVISLRARIAASIPVVDVSAEVRAQTTRIVRTGHTVSITLVPPT